MESCVGNLINHKSNKKRVKREKKGREKKGHVHQNMRKFCFAKFPMCALRVENKTTW
jgi:hypothetical protein